MRPRTWKQWLWGTVNSSRWNSLHLDLNWSLMGQLRASQPFRNSKLLSFMVWSRGWQCSSLKQDIYPLYQESGPAKLTARERYLSSVTCRKVGRFVRGTEPFRYLQQVFRGHCLPAWGGSSRWYTQVQVKVGSRRRQAARLSCWHPSPQATRHQGVCWGKNINLCEGCRDLFVLAAYRDVWEVIHSDTHHFI